MLKDKNKQTKKEEKHDWTSDPLSQNPGSLGLCEVSQYNLQIYCK